MHKGLEKFCSQNAAFGHWVGVYGRLFVAEIVTHRGTLYIHAATNKGVTSFRVTPTGLIRGGNKTTPWKEYYPCQH